MCVILAVASCTQHATPAVSRSSAAATTLVVSDKVYEYGYLRAILAGMCARLCSATGAAWHSAGM